MVEAMPLDDVGVALGVEPHEHGPPRRAGEGRQLAHLLLGIVEQGNDGGLAAIALGKQLGQRHAAHDGQHLVEAFPLLGRNGGPVFHAVEQAEIHAAVAQEIVGVPGHVLGDQRRQGVRLGAGELQKEPATAGALVEVRIELPCRRHGERIDDGRQIGPIQRHIAAIVLPQLEASAHFRERLFDTHAADLAGDVQNLAAKVLGAGDYFGPFQVLHPALHLAAVEAAHGEQESQQRFLVVGIGVDWLAIDQEFEVAGVDPQGLQQLART
jgi:hypothetical protein